MKQQSKNPLRVIWQTPLLRRILSVVLLSSILLPAYELLTVYPSFEKLITNLIVKEANRTAHHLLHVLNGSSQDISELSSHNYDQHDWERLKRSSIDYGLWKTRVFSTDGTIIFSTIAKETGEKNKHDYFFNLVAKGQSFSKLEKKESRTMEGEVLPLDVVEVYVPAMNDNDFLGAIEVYYDITEERESLKSLLFNSSLIFIVLILFFLLIFVLLLIKTARESIQLSLTQKELSTQEKIFRDVINSAHDGILVTNAQQQITIVNPAFSKITGYTANEVLGKTPNVLKSNVHEKSFYKAMWQTINTEKYWHGEIWNKCRDGRNIPELLSISTIEDDSEQITHYVGIYSDISEQKASEQRYQDMAYHDPLTGLSNRLSFLDKANHAILDCAHSGEKMAILFLDLDSFKQVNDNGGHEAGDALLQKIAARLSSKVRNEDTVARMGGDEFTFIFRNIKNKAVLERIANTLINSINVPVVIDNNTYHVGASIGIACYPDDAKDVETLLATADEAMYAAKQAGKNRFVINCISD